MTVLIETCADVDALMDLARDAEGDGHRMVSRLIADWREGTNRFEAPGECLYSASEKGAMLAVGGLNVDPFVSDRGVGRVRRLYVSANLRRRGIGSMLVDRLVQEARTTFDLLRLRTFNPAAAAFYTSCGFTEVSGDETCTHQLRLEPTEIAR